MPECVRRCLLVLAFCLGAGCAVQQPGPAALTFDTDLVSAEQLFGQTSLADEVAEFDILGPSEAMTAFVSGDVSRPRLSVARFKRLMAKLDESGYFGATYDPDATKTAADTFAARRGNCLSYTNMFISLARSIGLDAAYQIVDIPPTWDADTGLLIRNNHVNVVLKGYRFTINEGSTYTVDFNRVQPDERSHRHEISDAYAESLFYANLSVEAMRRLAFRQSFAYLQLAIARAPENPDLWINLGAIYALHDRLDAARRSYEHALTLGADNKSAIAGLASVYERAGDEQQAAHYREIVRRYRMRNPHFHLAVAQTAYDRAEYDKSMQAIDRALSLDDRDGRFHFLKGLLLQRAGDLDAARRSFRKAERIGNTGDMRRRYADELAHS